MWRKAQGRSKVTYLKDKCFLSGFHYNWRVPKSAQDFYYIVGKGKDPVTGGRGLDVLLNTAELSLRCGSSLLCLVSGVNMA